MTWKRLKGTLIGRVRDDSPAPADADPVADPPGRFSCEAIVLELDHGRTLTIRREPLGGQDSVTLLAEITRADLTPAARIVLRASDPGRIHLNIEQSK